MQARVGDWLFVRNHSGGRGGRRAAIVAVRDGGNPPYTVRWIDNDHEALIFPAPGDEVITAEELAVLNTEQDARFMAVQSAIAAGSVRRDDEAVRS